MKKIIISVILGIPLALISLAIYGLVYKTEIEHLILCVTDDTHYMPPSVCELYLYNFRPTQEDIEEMNAAAGISFISAIESPKRERLMTHFIDKGLSVNGISHYSGQTALHAAIIFNDHKMVKFLLEHGADPYVKSTDEDASGLDITKKYQFLTAIELLDMISEKKPDVNRDMIKALLAPYR